MILQQLVLKAYSYMCSAAFRKITGRRTFLLLLVVVGFCIFFLIHLNNGKFCLKLFPFKQVEVPAGVTDFLWLQGDNLELSDVEANK